jgi:ABC-type oligopeptide transport system substrate-binding subunit
MSVKYLIQIICCCLFVLLTLSAPVKKHSPSKTGKRKLKVTTTTTTTVNPSLSKIAAENLTLPESFQNQIDYEALGERLFHGDDSVYHR